MGSSVSPRQLALALDHAVSFAREDFLSGVSNITVLALIDHWPDWPNPVMALVGPEGAGKSHLAAIWAAEAGARVIAARLLPQVDPVAAFATGSLVIEDFSPENLDEPALFHLLNLAREEHAFLLITTRSAPAGWLVSLPDLASRLRALPVVTVAPPDDALLRALIVKLTIDRQLAVDDGLVNYLANRIERSFAAARAAVTQLDRESMRQQRPLTRVLAAELFRDGA